MKAALLSTLLFGAAVSAANHYHGYRVYRVDHDSFARNPHTLSRLSVTTWNDPGEWEHEGHVDIMVKPEEVADFEAIGLKYDVMHHDLGKSMDEESDFAEYRAQAVDDTYFDSYHPYDDHLQFLSDLQSKYPDQSEIVSSGESDGGLNITGIHLWGSGGKGKKPAVVFHGNVHAREWITSMTTEFFAYSLLKNYTSDAATKKYVDAYDFHIFPVVNPDGFTYSQTNQRMWRKNRQKNSGSSCVGTDINRNWPAGWSIPGGSSTDPCNEAYRGPSVTSAPETQGLTKYISGLSNAGGVQLYIDFHSYSQLWMSPYGYSCSKKPSNSAKQDSLAAAAGNAIKAVFGTKYETGPICPTIYQTSGDSVDWTIDNAGAKFAFAVELRDTGRYGFILPPNQIRPTAQETYAGLEAVFKGM